MDRPTKKRRLDPCDSFSIPDSPSRHVGTSAAPRVPGTSKPKFSLALPPGFRPDTAPAGPQEDQRPNAQAGPSKSPAKPVIKAPLYGLPGLSGFGSPSSHGSSITPRRPGQTTSTPVRPLASLSSASPFPFPSHLASAHQKTHSPKHSNLTPLRPMSNLRPGSPFPTESKNVEATPERKSMKSLMALKPVLRNRGAVDEIEDSAGEEDEDDTDQIEVSDDRTSRMRIVEESPSKPGPAMRNGEMSLAARLSALIVRQEASLSLFHTNLRLSSQPKSTGTNIRPPNLKSTSHSIQQRAQSNQTPSHFRQPSSITSIAGPSSSILDSADVVLDVMEVLLPIQHGCPLFRAKIIRSDQTIKKALSDRDAPPGKGETSISTGIDDNPFLETAPSKSTRRRIDASTESLDIILVTFLPHSAATSTTTSSRSLGIDPRGLADGMKAYQAAKKADDTQTRKRSIEVGIWKPFHLVELGSTRPGSMEVDKVKDSGAGTRGASDEVSSALMAIMCSRYVILEVG